MLKNIQTNFKLKTLIAIFLIPILSLGFFVGQARAEWANHLVISAVQITEGTGKTGHDFIEIYNPTDGDINLDDYRLVKRSESGVSDDSIKAWGNDDIIKAHSWRLWASSKEDGYNSTIKADDATVDVISSDNGVAIRLGAENTGEIIDSIAWGLAKNIFKEGSVSFNPGVSESLVRKPGSGNGNGGDTNNNFNDFFIITNFIPHNFQSAAEPAIINSLATNSTPTPSSNLSAEPSSSPVASILPFQINLPVAEAGTDKEAVLGENLDFDGSDSFDPAGKDLIFTWDFGDKTGAKGENVSHVYKETGEYSVILKVDNGESVGEDTAKARIIAPEFSDKVILSEIFPNPIGADKDGEWIELFNSGDKKINLKGWILGTTAKTGGKQYIFSGNKFIEAKTYLVIKRSENGLALTNESGKASLVWPPDKILSEVAYGAAKEGKSYAFINNAWQWVDAPTPGKENSMKILAAVSKVKENTVSLADVSENSNVQKISNSEQISSNEDAATSNTAVNSLSAKNNISQLGKSASVEDFLDKLIAEKIDKAILKAKASEAVSREKVLALADNAAENGIASIDKESGCKDFCAESDKNIMNNQKDARNNPWFYGDLVLSALSLFLVWRYQEIRKKLK